jgi:hypothetical protein
MRTERKPTSKEKGFLTICLYPENSSIEGYRKAENRKINLVSLIPRRVFLNTIR